MLKSAENMLLAICKQNTAKWVNSNVCSKSPSLSIYI